MLDHTVSVRVLGRVGIDDPELDRSLGRGRARELLGLLAARPDPPISTAEIVDSLWFDVPPPTAPTIVHGLVRRLRKILGEAIVHREPTGYRLVLPEDAVDLWSVLAAIRSGDHRRARSLWRDPAFGSYTEHPWARAAVAGLPQIHHLLPAGITTRRSRLDAPVGRLVGRRRELREVGTALERSRLVTIVGLGGVGKSRLALETAVNTPGSERVDLGASTGPVLGRIARDLGLAASGDPEWDLHTLSSVIGHRRLLLLLDGCEHDASGSASAVESLLATCPRLTVLATSRSALGVPGERIIPLLPFADPADPQGDSVALLIDRATELGVLATAHDRRRLATLCARTGGVPLAIELSATNTIFETPAAEAATVGEPPAVAVGSVIDQTLDSLTPGASTAIHRASRLVDGFTPSLLERIRAEGTSAPGILYELQATGLLRSSTAERARRFRLLDPIRHRLLDRPDDRARLIVAEALHAVHTAFRPDLDQPTVLTAYDESLAELGNTESLITDLMATGDHETALRLVHAAVDTWSESGAWTRSGALIESALAPVRPGHVFTPVPDEVAPADGIPIDPLVWIRAVRARALARATYASMHADHDRLRTAASIAGEIGETALEADLHFGLALANGYGGDLETARAHARRLRRLAESNGSAYKSLFIDQLEALDLLLTGEPVAAADALTKAAEALRDLDALGDAARTHRLAGLAHRMVGDTNAALRSLTEAETLALGSRSHGTLATIRTDLVDLRHRTGGLDRSMIVDALDTVLGVGNLRAAGLLRLRLGVLDDDPASLAEAALDLLPSDRVWTTVALAELHRRIPRRHRLRSLLPSAASVFRTQWGSPLGPEEEQLVGALLTTDDHGAGWSDDLEAELNSLLREVTLDRSAA